MLQSKPVAPADASIMRRAGELRGDLDATIYKFVKVERDAYDDTTTRAESVTEAARTANERYPKNG